MTKQPQEKFMTSKSYSFQEGLTAMAAKAVGIDPDLAIGAGDDARAVISSLRAAANSQASTRQKHLADTQRLLAKINPKTHAQFVNAITAKRLALQGRGSDQELAHLEPGEVVIPRALMTPVLLSAIEAEARRQGLDVQGMVVGEGSASVNPATGIEEFGLWDWVKRNFKTELKTDFKKPFWIANEETEAEPEPASMLPKQPLAEIKVPEMTGDEVLARARGVSPYTNTGLYSLRRLAD
jgi:hypothetical protein